MISSDILLRLPKNFIYIDIFFSVKKIKILMNMMYSVLSQIMPKQVVNAYFGRCTIKKNTTEIQQCYVPTGFLISPAHLPENSCKYGVARSVVIKEGLRTNAVFLQKPNLLI